MFIQDKYYKVYNSKVNLKTLLFFCQKLIYFKNNLLKCAIMFVVLPKGKKI